jgi:hypothetical protein
VRLLCLAFLAVGACRSSPSRTVPTGPPAVQSPRESAANLAIGRIRIASGTYGSTCDLPHGNRTQHLAASCDGFESCAYRVDRTTLGDPASGCPKEYLAEWRCDNDPNLRRSFAPPEADGTFLYLDCYTSNFLIPSNPRRDTKPSHTIAVVSASYGVNCGAAPGNVTDYLDLECNGRTACRYHIRWHGIVDNRLKCAKNYLAEWRCGDGPVVHRATATPEAGLGAVILLACGEISPSLRSNGDWDESYEGRPTPAPIPGPSRGLLSAPDK